LEFLKPGTSIDFAGKMRPAIFISIVLILISLASLIFQKGPNWGIEFTGGTEIHIKLADTVNIDELKSVLKGYKSFLTILKLMTISYIRK